MIDPTAQYDYEERQNFLEAQRAGKKTGLDDGPPNSIIRDSDQHHDCFYCGRSLAAERERNAELVEALNAITDYTYEAAIPGGDGKLQKLRAHAAAALAKNGGKP